MFAVQALRRWHLVTRGATCLHKSRSTMRCASAGSSHLPIPEFSIREWRSSQHRQLRLSRFVPCENTGDRRPRDCFRLDATTRLRAVRRLAGHGLAVQTKPLARVRPPRIASLGGVGDPQQRADRVCSVGAIDLRDRPEPQHAASHWPGLPLQRDALGQRLALCCLKPSESRSGLSVAHHSKARLLRIFSRSIWESSRKQPYRTRSVSLRTRSDANLTSGYPSRRALPHAIVTCVRVVICRRPRWVVSASV